MLRALILITVKMIICAFISFPAFSQEFSVNPNTGSISISPKCSNCAYTGFLYEAAIGIEVQNVTDTDLEVGLVANSVVVGNCGGENYKTRGLVPIENPDLAKDYDWTNFAPNMSVLVQSFINERCLEQFFSREEARVSLTLWVRLNGTIKRLPIQAANVPVAYKKK
ncbi:MAG: hypothetical protein P1V21_01060 [Rhizobiaceae bacterium]|nr:hypothetical protein [Rhizobiaceae bacterium]